MPSSSTEPPPPGPTVVRTVARLRSEVARLRSTGRRIAVVPTMGAFHEGHLSLMRRAARGGDAVVVTLFVNPTQFAPTEDLSRYPRDEAGDLALAAELGMDLVFAPAADEVYPEGFGTTITVRGPSSGLEGAARPDHFAGVATVVAKLLLAVRPDVAVFGRKDAQQLAVVRRLMTDLHLDDIELVAGPIVREADGLALSSRNAYLDAEDRAAAATLHRALSAGAALAADGERDCRRIEDVARAIVAGEPRCALDYVAAVDRDSFAPLAELSGDALLAIAARVGPVRLIDNVDLPRHAPVPRVTRGPATPTGEIALAVKERS